MRNFLGVMSILCWRAGKMVFLWDGGINACLITDDFLIIRAPPAADFTTVKVAFVDKR